MILAFDTETTGLPDFRRPSDDPEQPHLVQLAALLIDHDSREASAINLIIRPDGWTIPGEVAAIHGTDTEKAMRCGVREEIAVVLFRDMVDRADLVVAHNVSFDEKIMRIACARYGRPKELGKPTACTMKASLDLVNLPPTERMVAAGFNKPKPPKLSECIKHFFGEDLTGAHDALVDVRACARVFAHLRQIGAIVHQQEAAQ